MYKLKLHLHGSEVQELELVSGQEYTFGRGASCTVQLEHGTGISRVHFRVFEDNGQWCAQVVSKFGDILHAGAPTQTLPLEVGTVFKLASYDFHFVEKVAAAQVSESLPAAVGQSDLGGAPLANPPAHLSLVQDTPDFDGNEEVTRVTSVMLEAPYIRVVQASGASQSIKLEGRRWIAGREDGCEILLDDRKASRRQIELTSSPQGYFVRDLGSANGTMLNGSQLASDELKPLRSGDVIQIGSTALHFEVRDPNFDKKLMVIAPENRSGFPVHVQNPYEMINYPVPAGPGGAVRLYSENKGVFGTPWGADFEEPKKKKVKFYLVIAVVLVFGFIFFNGDSGKKAKKPVAVNEAYHRLSPKQQQMVQETYISAKNLYMQGKLAWASDQLKKIHEMLPEGFENSLAMANECRAQAEQEDQLRYIKDQQAKQAENRRIVESAIHHCSPLANRTFNVSEILSCFGEAKALDPENPKLLELEMKVKMRAEQRQQSAANQRQYQANVRKGEALFEKAEGLERRSEFLDAIAAYRKHINSGYPDPQGLRARSQKNMAALSQGLTSKIEDTLKAAEGAFSSQNYREAIEQVKRAKSYDPMNERAAELNARFRRELNAKLKELYEDSIISEGLGNIDGAKTQWKKIIDTDHPDGDYYKKARSKLRNYGAF